MRQLVEPVLKKSVILWVYISRNEQKTATQRRTMLIPNVHISLQESYIRDLASDFMYCHICCCVLHSKWAFCANEFDRGKYGKILPLFFISLSTFLFKYSFSAKVFIGGIKRRNGRETRSYAWKQYRTANWIR